MKINEYLKGNNILYFDGGMGTILQSKGMQPGEKSESWNITHPEIITSIHKDYYDAGSNVITMNTFGVNGLKYSCKEIERIVDASYACANKARELSYNTKDKYIALDIGPSGKLLKPYGDLDFEDAIKAFSPIVKAGVKCGVDLVIIETFNDLYEVKAAILAVKENSDLPIIVSCAYGEDGRLMTGSSPEVVVSTLEGLGVAALGLNCSFGPYMLRPITEQYLKFASIPVILQPNAGMPRVENGKTIFDIGPNEFATALIEEAKKGVSILGGCCGTTPEHIKALVNQTSNIKLVKNKNKKRTIINSSLQCVIFDSTCKIIGERINPTGKKKLKQALIDGDIGYILNEGIKQVENGAEILDVNVGVPGINEPEVLKNVVENLQTVVEVPLQIDSTNPLALEKAIRTYNGKPLINSVNGKKESMEIVFPLVKKYGGVVIALTLDENGIPNTSNERLAIAKNILKVAKEYGIEKEDIIFDPLTLTIGTDTQAAIITLESVYKIKNELGCKTSLGISNVSYGLPQRELLNGTFLSLAINNGLNAAIINPLNANLMQNYYASSALMGYDSNSSKYINYCNSLEKNLLSNNTKDIQSKTEYNLVELIINGLKDKIESKTIELLKDNKPLDVVNNYIIPALDIVGKKYENKEIYLPQLLMSAECSSVAFAVIKTKYSNQNSNTRSKVVIATVKGDIHDIGKNIVKLLLENYGFNVIDLGKDVEPIDILNAVKENNAPFCGLSALMTTTLPAMEETIKLLHENKCNCKIIVGGAVLNEEYSKKIKADAYSKDAMDTVRYCSENELSK